MSNSSLPTPSIRIMAGHLEIVTFGFLLIISAITFPSSLALIVTPHRLDCWCENLKLYADFVRELAVWLKVVPPLATVLQFSTEWTQNDLSRAHKHLQSAAPSAVVATRWAEVGALPPRCRGSNA